MLPNDSTIDDDELPAAFQHGRRLHPHLTVDDVDPNALIVLSTGLRGKGGAWSYLKHMYREVAHFHNPMVRLPVNQRFAFMF